MKNRSILLSAMCFALLLSTPQANAFQSDESLQKEAIEFKDGSPLEVFETFRKAAKKRDWNTYAKCLTKRSMMELTGTSIQVRKITEIVGSGQLPKSMSKKELDRLKAWAEELDEFYEKHGVGTFEDERTVRQKLANLTDRETYIGEFMSIYLSEKAPKNIRDRVKGLWFSGGAKVKKMKKRKKSKVEPSVASLELIGKKRSKKKRTFVDFKKEDGGWRIDGKK